jgi:hypothetical protein
MEGGNSGVEERYAAGNVERYPELVAEAVAASAGPVTVT